jgi:hypothetical protein
MLFPFTLLMIHVFILFRHWTNACMVHFLDRHASSGTIVPAVRWLHVAIMAALEVVESLSPGRHGRLEARGSGQLLQFPHVLPLLFGSHFVVGR